MRNFKLILVTGLKPYFVWVLCLFSTMGFAQNLSPEQELEAFLQSQSRPLRGVFTVTADTVDDNKDEYLVFNSELIWSVKKKSFSLKLLAEDAKSPGTMFSFSWAEGFQFQEPNGAIHKSDPLNFFYRKLWAAGGKFELANAFDIKRLAVIEDRKLLHYEYGLKLKGKINSLPIKDIQINLSPDLKKLLLLKFYISPKLYVWAPEEF